MMGARQITTTYCTLYRLGHWASLDAECETEADEACGFTTHTHRVRFALIGKYGETTSMGLFLFNQLNLDSPVVLDESGDDYPNLAAAIRDTAKALLTLTAVRSRWSSEPPTHGTFGGEDRAAFELNSATSARREA